MTLDIMICPFCEGEMTPYREQREDWSGWRYGWLCDCDSEARADMEQVELVIWAPAPPPEEER